MKMENVEKQISLIEGALRKEFLKSLNITITNDYLKIPDNEITRQEIIREIKTGKLKLSK